MKKIRKAMALVSTLMLLSASFFTACSSDDEEGVNVPGNSSATNPGTSQPGGNPSTPGNGGEHNSQPENPVEEETPVVKPSDLDSYYKEYLLGGAADDAKVSVTWDSWGSGTVKDDNDDGSVSITNGTEWGNVACSAYNNISEGYFSRYEYIVVTADLTDFTLSTGSGDNDGANIKVPEVIKKIASYGTTNSDGTVTYVVPLSIYGNAVNTATQVALIFGGSGTVRFTEFYVASSEQPAADYSLLTASIASATETVNAATVGENAGEYTQESVDALNGAIAAAQAIVEGASSTQAEIDAMRTALLEAVKTFNASVILPSDAVPVELAAIENEPLHVIFSSTRESDVTVTDWAQYWGGSPTWSAYEVSVNGEAKAVKKLTSNGWFGMAGITSNDEFISTAADGDKHVFLHIDFYTKDAVTVRTVVSVNKTNGAKEKDFSTEAGEYGWKGIDADLSKLHSAPEAVFFQLGFGGMNDVFVDNIYFYEKDVPVVIDPNAVPSAVAPAISNDIRALYYSSTDTSDVVTTNFGQNWHALGGIDDYEISEGASVKKISYTDEGGCCGWAGESEVTDDTFLHAEVYTNSDFKIKPVDSGFGYEYLVHASEYKWHSVDIPLKTGSDTYAWNGDKLAQIGFISTTGDDLYVDNVYTYDKEIPVTEEALPVIPMGNQMSKIDGSGIWIYLDNTSMKISGGNASDIAGNMTLSVKDSLTEEAVTVTEFRFDDYGANTVRLYIGMENAAHTTVDVAVEIPIAKKIYKGTSKFVSGAYQFDYEPTAITLSASAVEVKPQEAVTLKVKGTPYNIDITDKCTFTISESDTTGSSISGNVLTAGSADGTVTVTAKFGSLEKTIDVVINANALPTIMSTSKIEGAGVMIYISKDVVATTPAKEDVTVSGKLESTDSAWNGYVSDNLALNLLDVLDQGNQTYIYFTQPAGFPNGADITETFVITWDNVTVNAEFYGNALKSSSVIIAE